MPGVPALRSCHSEQLFGVQLETGKPGGIGFARPALRGAGAVFEEGREVIFHFSWIKKAGGMRHRAISGREFNLRQGSRLGCV